MSQRVSRTLSSDCYVASRNDTYAGRHIPLHADTSSIIDVNLRSAAQIGQRLAVIGDEFHRQYDMRFHNKMAHVIRESIRIAGNCQVFVLSLLRSVKNITSRVDRGVTQNPGRPALVSMREPGALFPNVLLLAALAAVCGLIIKLGLDD